MFRFAILNHDHPFPHWDFLLENGESCRTWRLLSSPDSSDLEISAEELPDHRLMYLEYEGPVSGQRGRVTRWDGGTFEWQANQSDLCDVRLAGQKWRGIVRLVRMTNRDWKAFRLFDGLRST